MLAHSETGAPHIGHWITVPCDGMAKTSSVIALLRLKNLFALNHDSHDVQDGVVDLLQQVGDGSWKISITIGVLGGVPGQVTDRLMKREQICVCEVLIAERMVPIPVRELQQLGQSSHSFPPMVISRMVRMSPVEGSYAIRQEITSSRRAARVWRVPPWVMRSS